MHFFSISPSPILYSSVTSPFFSRCILQKIYDRQFCFFCCNVHHYISDSFHLEEVVHCTGMNENPGYHYYYYYQVLGWKKRKKYICVYEYWHRHSADNSSLEIWHKEERKKEQYSSVARNGRYSNRCYFKVRIIVLDKKQTFLFCISGWQKTIL